MSDLNRIQNTEPSFITDAAGTVSASVTASALTGSENALVVRSIESGIVPATDTYAACYLNTTFALAINSTTSVFYLWHPASVTRNYYIQQITLMTDSGGGTAKFNFRVTKITAQNATPGGTTMTALPLNSSSPASNSVLNYGANAPTRMATDYYSVPVLGSMSVTNVLTVPSGVTPLKCSAGVAEGWEVRVDNLTILLSTLRVSVQFVWTEV